MLLWSRFQKESFASFLLNFVIGLKKIMKPATLSKTQVFPVNIAKFLGAAF